MTVIRPVKRIPLILVTKIALTPMSRQIPWAPLLCSGQVWRDLTTDPLRKILMMSLVMLR